MQRHIATLWQDKGVTPVSLTLASAELHECLIQV